MKTNSNNTLFITIAIAVVIGVGGFFAGMKYQQTKQPSFSRNGTNNFMMGGTQNGQGINGQTKIGGTRMGGGQIMGDILSQDATSITVKLADGSSKIVLFNDKTTVNKAAEATTGDLKTGEKVAVFGQTNTDGSVTATNIQLNPILRGQATGSGIPR